MAARRISTVRTSTEDEKSLEILEVPKTASKDDLKKAYFKLAKQYHPDVNKTQEAKEKFASINE